MSENLIIKLKYKNIIKSMSFDIGEIICKEKYIYIY